MTKPVTNPTPTAVARGHLGSRWSSGVVLATAGLAAAAAAASPPGADFWTLLVICGLLQCAVLSLAVSEAVLSPAAARGCGYGRQGERSRWRTNIAPKAWP